MKVAYNNMVSLWTKLAYKHIYQSYTYNPFFSKTNGSSVKKMNWIKLLNVANYINLFIIILRVSHFCLFVKIQQEYPLNGKIESERDWEKPLTEDCLCYLSIDHRQGEGRGFTPRMRIGQWQLRCNLSCYTNFSIG